MCFNPMPSAAHHNGKRRGRKGETMITVEEQQSLIHNIKCTLDECAAKLIADKISSNRRWTYECLQRLAKFGVDNGYGVCPWCENMKGEWLYDLIWFKEKKSDWPNQMTDVLLVGESEWRTGIGDIRYDFQKLIQAKSALKLLICQELNETDLKILAEDIEVFVAKDESEIFLFASYYDELKRFKYGIYHAGQSSKIILKQNADKGIWEGAK